MKIFLSCFFALLLLPQCSMADSISIAGSTSTTVKKFMELAAEKYQENHPEVSFNINGGGSTDGFGEAISKNAHIGMMSRELTAEEEGELGAYQLMTIAYDAVTPVVSHEIYHSGNITSISMENLAKIYRGEINNWRELGGSDRLILVVDKEIHRGTRYVFAQALLGSPTAKAREDAVVIEDNLDVANLVKASDQAIAYVSFSYADDDVHALDILVDGKLIVPNQQNIRRVFSPFSRKLHLIVPKHSPAYVQAFIDFVLSPEGQAIVKQAGYVSVLHGS